MSPIHPPDVSHKILIAVVGNSPAVLTETVWALAHQPSPWIPDQVVMITTLTGRAIETDCGRAVAQRRGLMNIVGRILNGGAVSNIEIRSGKAAAKISPVEGFDFLHHLRRKTAFAMRVIKFTAHPPVPSSDSDSCETLPPAWLNGWQQGYLTFSI